MRGVSVVICCYNSSSRIPETLKYLAKQTVVEDLPWEIILVDNASTDNTKQIAASLSPLFQNKSGFRIEIESQPGLSHARKKGIGCSQYSYILFCDDDNWLDHDYIQSAYDIMESDPTIGACGGNGIAVCEVPEPDWFQYFERPYAVGKALPSSGFIIDPKGFLTGAGMFLRRTAWQTLEQAGFKSLLSDRKGSDLSSGGDLEICYALKIAGFQLFYNDEISYRHFISKERLTVAYLKKLHKGIGRSGVLTDVYQYVLNGWDTKKSFLWARVLCLLTPKLLKAMFNPTGHIKKQMENISLKSYYQQLAGLRGEFDEAIHRITQFERKLQQAGVNAQMLTVQ